MRLHEQNKERAKVLADIEAELRDFRASVLRKIAAQYPDGSRDNLINAETDVLPRIEWLLRGIDTANDAMRSTQ